MSVYTPVSPEQAQTLLADYAIGQWTAQTPIASGLENTNYFLTTVDAGREHEWVLTLIEQVDDSTVACVAQLTRACVKQGLAVAAPEPRRDGLLYAPFLGKQCVITPRFSGAAVTRVTPAHCAQIGRFLAQLHAAFLVAEHTNDADIASVEFVHQAQFSPQAVQAFRQGCRAVDSLRWSEQLSVVADVVSPEHYAIAEEVMAAYEAVPKSLARAMIHGDLFTDNALFEGDTLSVVLDFYNATLDYCLYDVAIAINDWCRDASSPSGLCAERFAAFLTAYETHRSLQVDERAHLLVMLKAAALRFGLSRILTQQWQQTQATSDSEAAPVSHKDPAERWQLLQQLDTYGAALIRDAYHGELA